MMLPNGKPLDEPRDWERNDHPSPVFAGMWWAMRFVGPFWILVIWLALHAHC